MKTYIRKALFKALWEALHGEINLIQAVVGPRQVGKTTLALQILQKWSGPKLYETADQPRLPSANWIATQWQKAHDLSLDHKKKTLLVLDEIQKIPGWSEIVKKLYDEDKRDKKLIRILLLGSSSLLIQKGLVESLAGRFELHRHYQWSFEECYKCFGLSLSEYIYFGGYPGALPLRKDETRWARYIRDSLIETVLSKDVLLMSPITKPALLRQTFGLAVDHPAQILSYQKMLGTLQDAGNTTTVASYLRLLSNAFLLSPIEKWSGSRIKKRGSTPKILIMDNALISSMAGGKFRETLKDRTAWGRLIENAVGAKIHILMKELGGELYYWRLRRDEIDYILRIGKKLLAVEVKSGIPNKAPVALPLFKRKYKNAELIIITNSRIKNTIPVKIIKLSDFLENPKNSLGLS